jgi:DNA-binding Xre family transcriptional regulator
MQMRLRLPELLAEHKPPLTAYGVHKAAGKDKEGKHRISLSTIYRLNRNEGRVTNFDGELLEALCDVFGVEPGRLLEREGVGKKVKRRGRKA